MSPYATTQMAATIERACSLCFTTTGQPFNVQNRSASTLLLLTTSLLKRLVTTSCWSVLVSITSWPYPFVTAPHFGNDVLSFPDRTNLFCLLIIEYHTYIFLVSYGSSLPPQLWLHK